MKLTRTEKEAFYNIATVMLKNRRILQDHIVESIYYTQSCDKNIKIIVFMHLIPILYTVL